MKKNLVKLMIYSIGVIYLCSTQNIADSKTKMRELINKPFIQLEQQINNLLQIP